jgi:hypothetical protein
VSALSRPPRAALAPLAAGTGTLVARDAQHEYVFVEK